MLHGNINRFFSSSPEDFTGIALLTIPTSIVSEHLSIDLDDPVASALIEISYSYDHDKSRRRGLIRGFHSHGHTENNETITDKRKKISSSRSLRADYSGVFKTLVVRVSDNRGHEPTYSANQLYRHIFTSEFNMVRRRRKSLTFLMNCFWNARVSHFCD